MEDKTKTLRQWLGSGSINIFGRPFAGKDTQSKNLSTIFHAPIISGGDIIRSSADQIEMQRVIDKGNLAPQQDFLKLTIPYLSHEEYIGKPLILNSLGRWHGEEDPILNAAHVTRHPIKAVIHLNISEDDVWNRWEQAKKTNDRGYRNDDNDISIRNRLGEFKNKTLPVIEYYENRELLITVDGVNAPDKITQDILILLYEKIDAQKDQQKLSH